MTSADQKKKDRHRASRGKADNNRAAPWDQDNPKGKDEHQHLSPQARATAKRRAHAAGRPYPNLVDNMRVAREGKEKKK